MRTGAVEAGIMGMIRKGNGKEKFLLPVLFIFFSLGGAIWGMGEESIPFAMLLVPMVIAMGYDAVTGVLITYVATQIGFWHIVDESIFCCHRPRCGRRSRPFWRYIQSRSLDYLYWYGNGYDAVPRQQS